MGRMAPAMGLHGRCPIRPVYLPFSMEARMKNAKMAASSGRAEQLNAMITQVHVGRLTILDGSMLFVHADRSEERRVGKECVSTFRSRWSRVHQKQKSDSRKSPNRHHKR